ncbi:unnamed protein product, partial [Phaeothamnion confervicola]
KTRSAGPAEGEGHSAKRAKPAAALVPPPSPLSERELSTVEIHVNRAPVMLLWAATVASHRGFDWGEALSIGRAAADWFAQRKGEHYGILLATAATGAAAATTSGATAAKAADDEATCPLEVLGINIELRRTEDGWRALSKGSPASAANADSYLRRSFGEQLGPAAAAFAALAASLPPPDLEVGRKTYMLYEDFRPMVASGAAGWGQRGVLRLARVLELREDGGDGIGGGGAENG